MFKNGILDYSFPIEKDGQKIAIQQNKHWLKKVEHNKLKTHGMFSKIW